ncbi:MAG: 50S ribosomal protein L13 [bacterium]
MHTPFTSVEEAQATRRWWLVDLEGKTLGRTATTIASVLRGKHKPTFTPHVDDGDFVIVINAEKVHLTGRKWKDKKYFWHTRYPGGIREITAEKLRARFPDRILRMAVKGMLPRGPLGRQQLRKLKIYAGAQHPHQAQKPETLPL